MIVEVDADVLGWVADPDLAARDVPALLRRSGVAAFEHLRPSSGTRGARRGAVRADHRGDSVGLNAAGTVQHSAGGAERRPAWLATELDNLTVIAAAGYRERCTTVGLAVDPTVDGFVGFTLESQGDPLPLSVRCVPGSLNGMAVAAGGERASEPGIPGRGLDRGAAQPRDDPPTDLRLNLLVVGDRPRVIDVPLGRVAGVVKRDERAGRTRHLNDAGSRREPPDCLREPRASRMSPSTSFRLRAPDWLCGTGKLRVEPLLGISHAIEPKDGHQ